MDASEYIPLFSLSITLIGLIVAFLAYKHSVKSSQTTSEQMQRISEEHLKLSTQVALTGASQKYVLLLSEVKNEFERITHELSYPALKASIKIGEAIDKYDELELSRPYLKHCFNEVITLVREAYDQELTTQNGPYLINRIRSMKQIRDNLSKYEKEESDKSFFSIFKRNSKSDTPYENLHSLENYRENVRALFKRIPNKRQSDLFQETLGHLKEYRQLHESEQQRLQDLQNKLELAIKENSLEMYDISDIPKLGPEFLRIKDDIDRYKHLYFPDFEGLEEQFVVDGLAYSIYAGCITYIASQHFMWGKLR